jgi:type VI secretion system lysozyme-like protein
MYGEPLFVKEPKPQVGERPPLFDRLTDAHPDRYEDTYYTPVLGQRQIIESLIREITRVLNARTGARHAVYTKAHSHRHVYSTPALFGMRDLPSMDPANKNSWPAIARYCQQAIHSYEPRLNNVTVRVERFDVYHQRLHVAIRGTFHMQAFQGQVQFATTLDYGLAR